VDYKLTDWQSCMDADHVE